MRLTVISTFLFFLLATNVFGHRENTYYLYGQFGTTKVGVQIDEYGNQCTARYFTFDNKYDRILEGNILEDGHFNMRASTWNESKQEKVKGDSLSVKEVRKNIWEGKWIPLNGPAQPVHLYRIRVDSLNHPFIRAIKKYRISPYEAYRTKNLHFVDKRKERIGKGLAIMRVVDPESGVEWFRLIQNEKFLPQVDSINTWLTMQQIKAINAKYSCVNMGEKGDYQMDYNIRFMDRHVLSYIVTLHSACYGGDGQEPSTYNNTLQVATAKPLMLEDIIWFGGQPKPQLSEGEYNWFQYRYKVFGPKILDVMKSLYPDKITPADSTDCTYDDVKLWQFPSWYLTKKGLYLGSKSTMANKKCDGAPWSIIPYSMLKKYYSDDFKFLGNQ